MAVKTGSSEHIVDKWLKKAVEDAGGLIFKMHPITNAGIPDRLIHCRGMTFYVETKETGKPCSDIQIEMHAIIHKRGIAVYVLDQKVKDFWEIFQLAYTTYEGKHYNKNPFK